MRFFARVLAPISCISSLVLISSLIVPAAPAFALTKEEAVENCRMSIGKPTVQACMRAGEGSREACRERARPKVVACAIAALNAANRRANVAVGLPAEAAPKLTP